MPWRPFFFDSTTMASSKRFASRWTSTQLCLCPRGRGAHLKFGGISDATVQSEVLYGPYAMGRCKSITVSKYPESLITCNGTHNLRSQ